MSDWPLIAPGRLYNLAGHGDEWVMTHVFTAGDTATVHLVRAEAWAQMQVEREELAATLRRIREGGGDGD